MIDTSGLPFKKPAPREKRVRASTRRHRKERTAKRATENEVKAVTRALVFRLDPRCVVCLGPPSADDEMHEVIPRSKTRGRPPEERFNRQVCCRLCPSDHARVTANGITMAFLDSDAGVDGGLVFQYQLRAEQNRHAWVYRRGLSSHDKFYGGHLMVRGVVRRGIWTPEDNHADP